MNAHAPPLAGTVLDARAERARLDRAVQAAARLSERREAAIAREAVLTRQVGLAKGRLAARKDVEAVLDELQARQSRRNLGTFENLLTALVQEVLPGVPSIRLELGTERNLPALDILAERAGGNRESVYEDQGGAMTNVVSAGLRLIAVVKSRSALFVSLDEADCWIKPSRVPAFYRVLEDAARRLSVQCLAISHHDIESFGSEIGVSRLEGHPDDAAGVTIVPPSPGQDWPDAEAKGLRWIRLVDVQGYAEATLVLSPGVNALIGENNIGKSTIARVLRAVFYGQASDSLVRHGAKRCIVEIGVERGRVLRFLRQPGRTPVNTWSLHEPGGEVVEQGGERLESGAKAVPAWVDRLFGITPIQDLDIHIAHQKKPVFLLGEGPSKRASVLSVGQEADYARVMIRIQKERCASDTADVRDGERAIAEARRTVASLSGVEARAAELAGLAETLDALAEEQAAVAGEAAVLARLSASRTALQKAHAREFILGDLPDPDAVESMARDTRDLRADVAVADTLGQVLDRWHAAHARAGALDALPGGVPELLDNKPLIEAGTALRSGRRALARARAKAGILEALPADAPALERPDGDVGILAALTKGTAHLAAAREKAGRIAREEAAALERLEGVLRETGGHCPACGQAASARTLLQGHDHP